MIVLPRHKLQPESDRICDTQLSIECDDESNRVSRTLYRMEKWRLDPSSGNRIVLIEIGII